MYWGIKREGSREEKKKRREREAERERETEKINIKSEPQMYEIRWMVVV